MHSKLATSHQNNKMVHPNSGWTLPTDFEFSAIDDDTAVHAVCRHSRGSLSAFSLGFSFSLFCSAARGNSPLRGQVCMRHFPFVSDGSIFLGRV